MRHVIAYLSGLLFAVGLVVGGMTQPAKIVNFLDFFGSWDPSLAFVMGGALLVNVVAYRWSKRKEEPVFEQKFFIPTRSELDWRLVSGSVLFGVGWGLAGYCPGPAVTALGSAKGPVLAMVGGMLGGVFLYALFDRATAPASEETGGRAELADA